MEKKKRLTHGQKMRKKRIALWNENPNCHYCGELTILVDREGKGSGAQLPNEATIDHLFDRLDPRRCLPCKGETRYVLACYKCNHDRGNQRHRELTIDEIRYRARKWPITWLAIELERL